MFYRSLEALFIEVLSNQDEWRLIEKVEGGWLLLFSDPCVGKKNCSSGETMSPRRRRLLHLLTSDRLFLICRSPKLVRTIQKFEKRPGDVSARLLVLELPVQHSCGSPWKESRRPSRISSSFIA